jgi:hypothetical protein
LLRLPQEGKINYFHYGKLCMGNACNAINRTSEFLMPIENNILVVEKKKIQFYKMIIL